MKKKAENPDESNKQQQNQKDKKENKQNQKKNQQQNEKQYQQESQQERLYLKSMCDVKFYKDEIISRMLDIIHSSDGNGVKNQLTIIIDNVIKHYQYYLHSYQLTETFISELADALNIEKSFMLVDLEKVKIKIQVPTQEKKDALKTLSQNVTKSPSLKQEDWQNDIQNNKRFN